MLLDPNKNLPTSKVGRVPEMPYRIDITRVSANDEPLFKNSLSILMDLRLFEIFGHSKITIPVAQ
jgi:hypothetical protein